MCRIAPRASHVSRWHLIFGVLIALFVSGCSPFGPADQPAMPPTSALGGRVITLSSPQNNAVVTTPIAIAGTVSIVPVSGSLSYRLFGPDETLLDRGSFPVQGEAGGSGVFSGTIVYVIDQPGPGRIELLDLNPADGAILAMTALQVTLSTGETPASDALLTPTALPPPSPSDQQQIILDSPPPGTTVGSPVTIAGRTTKPPTGNLLTYVMRDASNAVLGTGSFPVLTTAASTGSFNASLTFNLPPNGGNITLELSDPGATGGTAVAESRLALVVAPPQTITIDSPPAGTLVGSPLTLTGRTARFPFQGSLAYRVLDANGRQLGNGNFPVPGAPGAPASFSASMTFGLPPNGGRITVEVVDQHASTGQVAGIARIELNVAPQQQAIIIESPAANQQVGSPITIVGRVVRLPSTSQLSYRVRDQGGQQIGTGMLGVTGSQDGGGHFNAQVLFNLPPNGGPITLELLEVDPVSGQVRTSASLPLSVALPPTPTPSATSTPQPTNTPVPARQSISINSPAPGTVVGSPVVISGRVALLPQFRELYYIVRTANRDTLGQGSFPVAGQPEETNLDYSTSIAFSVPPQGGNILIEIYDRDGVGQIIASAITQLQVPASNPITPTAGSAGVTQQIKITSPVSGTLVGNPATIDGSTTSAPYQQMLDYRVTDAAGNDIGKGSFAVRDVSGFGFIFSAAINFTPPPLGGPITLTIFDQNEATGAILAQQTLSLRVAPQPTFTPTPPSR